MENELNQFLIANYRFHAIVMILTHKKQFYAAH